MKPFGALVCEPVPACPACGAADRAPLTERADGAAVDRCGRCGTAYLAERPRDLAPLYDAGYFRLPDSEAEAGAAAGIGYETGYTEIQEQLWQAGWAAWVAEVLGAQAAGPLVDVGCATGQFLALARAFGFPDARGVELSRRAAAIAGRRGFEVAVADAAGWAPDRPLGLVTAWDLVEHLPDPRAFVDRVAGWLAPTGAFCFSTPDGDAAAPGWGGFGHSFEHLFYLGRDGLDALLAERFGYWTLHRYTIYGGEFLLGVATRDVPSPSQRAALEGLTAWAAGGPPGWLRPTPRAAAGLAATGMVLGRIGLAEAVLPHLDPGGRAPSEAPPLPPGLGPLLVGSVAARLGRFDEAAAAYRRAAAEPAVAEVAQASRAALGALQVARAEAQAAGAVAEAQATRDAALARAEAAERRAADALRAHEAYARDKEGYIYQLNAQLAQVGWALKLRRAPRALAGRARRLVGRLARAVAPRPVRAAWHALAAEGPTPEPAEPAWLVTGDAGLWPDHARRLDPRATPRLASVRCSLITTCFNEAGSVDRWLAALAAQTRLPDEVVVVDAGSRDGTAERLLAAAPGLPFPLRVVVDPGASIAHGRNRAVAEARHDVIAATDLGCHPEPGWLDALLAPLERIDGLDWAAGWTAADAETPFQRALADLTVSPPGSGDVDAYLPSSRTIAFTRPAFEAAGGYPEWLSFAGEDTLFAIWLMNRRPRRAVVPGAVVRWHMRDTWAQVRRQAYLYGKGDGEAALFARRYLGDLKRLGLLAAGAGALGLAGALAAASLWALAAGLLAAGAAAVGGLALQHARRLAALYLPPDQAPHAALRRRMLWVILAARAQGFVAGALARPRLAARRYAHTRGTAVIFSGVPIHDSGGGQRATQLALALLAAGWRVAFVNQYPSYESVAVRVQVQHPDLETAPIGRFDPGALLAGHDPARPLVAIAEFPLGSFLPALRALKAGSGRVVYDLIDDWQSSLGGDWYRPRDEQALVALSDGLVASARDLQARLAAESGRAVALVPNAVNTARFDRALAPATPPADLPVGQPVLMYVGALWGEWFDWGLLLAVATAHPDKQVVVIGDYKGECPEARPNLRFLGLKPQAELPAYLAAADVALIPFAVSKLTQAVSPLKVFEYLAMGLPVVSTPLKELDGLPYVVTAEGPAAFAAAVDAALAIPVEPAVVARFRRDHSWQARLAAMFAPLGLAEAVGPREATPAAGGAPGLAAPGGPRP